MVAFYNTKEPEDAIIQFEIDGITHIELSSERTEIKLCIENLCGIFDGIDDILYAIDRVGSEKLCVCLDTGHLNITKTSSQSEFILKAGKRLCALHIADNEGVVDQHIIPYGRGNVDFIEVARALREVEYDGVFNYEIGGDSGKCPIPVKHVKYLTVRATYDYIFDNA
ncbi:MAG: sugar phosphate isomerase/epimerase [Clostridia bacterium]|nr:sugar phosphate isomerase/epimerase [Clostridia bacterium]